MLSTFGLTVFAWIFFRAENISHAFSYINGIFSKSLLSISVLDIKNLTTGAHIIHIILIVIGFVFFEWFQRNKKHSLEFNINNKHRMLRWFLYYVLIILIILFQGGNSQFIYFQF